MRFLTGGIFYGSTNITTLALYQSLLVYLAHLLNDPLIIITNVSALAPSIQTIWIEMVFNE